MGVTLQLHSTTESKTLPAIVQCQIMYMNLHENNSLHASRAPSISSGLCRDGQCGTAGLSSLVLEVVFWCAKHYYINCCQKYYSPSPTPGRKSPPSLLEFMFYFLLVSQGKFSSDMFAFHMDHHTWREFQKGVQGQPIDIACWLSSLAQSVEQQHKKPSVVDSSSTGVHFAFHFLSLHHGRYGSEFSSPHRLTRLCWAGLPQTVITTLSIEVLRSFQNSGNREGYARLLNKMRHRSPYYMKHAYLYLHRLFTVHRTLQMYMYMQVVPVPSNADRCVTLFNLNMF